MNKIIDWIKKNKITVILSIIVLGVIILVTVIIFSSSDEDPVIEPGSVDQPLQYYDDKDIRIGEVELEEFPEDGMKVFDLIEANQVDIVRDFRVKIGAGAYTEEDHDSVRYLWMDSQSESIIEYSSIIDYVYFSFEESKTTSISKTLSQDSAKEYFVEFINEYFNESFEYMNFNVTSERGGFRVEANRNIDGYPLEISGHDNFSDYLVIEEDGDIISGKIYLFQYDYQKPVTVEVLTPIQLGSVIGRSDYPKEVHHFLAIGFDYSEYAYATGQISGSSYLGDGVDLSEANFPEPSYCVADDVYLVYHYMTNQYDKLTPNYHVDCTGSITVDGISYDVPMLIYASAIDPEYVYIPATQ